VSIGRFTRRWLRRGGWDLTRFSPLNSEWSQLSRQLSVHDATVVFDVGANVGQFARNLRDAGFRGRIVSFEASAFAHSKLAQEARNDPGWIVAPRMAIGNYDGKATINISANSVSSSLLPILAAHLTAEPASRYVDSEEVEMRQLDTVASQYCKLGEPSFLKIDVQGFEYQVLQGAQRFLDQICGIRLEMSLVPLYGGEQLFDSTLKRLQELGFALWSLVPGFVDSNSGRLLQVDGIFFRPS
jgi:FkbM family methyltransferase